MSVPQLLIHVLVNLYCGLDLKLMKLSTVPIEARFELHDELLALCYHIRNKFHVWNYVILVAL